MTKIAHQAANAFMQGRDFKSGNTRVVIDDGDAALLLHNNPIAQRDANGNLFITNAGWATTTTKDRLNGLPGVTVTQRDFTWYLNGREWTGELVQVHRDSGFTYVH